MNKSYSLAIVFFVLASNAHAALYDRGNGMIYDSSLNVTWLQDANYAKTSGYDVDGLMTLFDANAWVRNLNYSGYSGWRLPSVTTNEIEQLYYELGNKGVFTSPGLDPSEYGFHNKSFEDGHTHQAISFLNVSEANYWYGEHTLGDPLGRGFDTRLGYLGGAYPSDTYYAWAVHDGDVAAVPIPATAWLFGSGLLVFVGAARRKAL